MKWAGGARRSVNCDWHSQGLWKGGLVGGWSQSWVRREPGQKGDWFCMGGMKWGAAGGKKAGGGKVGSQESVGQAGGFWI